MSGRKTNNISPLANLAHDTHWPCKYNMIPTFKISLLKQVALTVWKNLGIKINQTYLRYVDSLALNVTVHLKKCKKQLSYFRWPFPFILHYVFHYAMTGLPPKSWVKVNFIMSFDQWETNFGNIKFWNKLCSLLYWMDNLMWEQHIWRQISSNHLIFSVCLDVWKVLSFFG